ncbi:anti-sigma factor [Antarcticibacterium arcticum]|uniref:Anti-sigma factor n=1 Tax=Antarcticibacterium arcticum TaxID=2585771 RepID=A0A5B8YKC4_9FLAO|nr:anti-sigma factor [Antarcticibacterium arcticum]QED37297.1 anti-sigma factor [Antarcticibacterium arcticum]
MDINEYINSGILELYVYGALTEEESAEVTRILKQYPDVKAEVEEIEAALLNLSAAVAPNNPEFLINSIKSKLSGNHNLTRPPKTSNLPSYIGWAASILLLVGLFFMFNKNRELRESLQALQAEKAQMESQIVDARESADKTRELLNVLRDRSILRVELQGQEVAPQAFATAYWDENTNTTYIDARDLPPPPRGMVYQVWSLKLQPLTPTSIGLLENFEEDENQIFVLSNSNESEAFGITLEPAGGSESPTMEQLYTLGVVSS